jgi:hypothetical protein
MKRLFLLPLLAAALALSGCGIFLSSKEKAMQKDPNYQSGYSDGCAAANAQNTDYRRGDGSRDDALFNTSKPYRSGWHSGFSACRSGYTQQPENQRNQMPSGGPIH